MIAKGFPRSLVLVAVMCIRMGFAQSSDWELPTETPGQIALKDYLTEETKRLTERSDPRRIDLSGAAQREYRRQLAEMLGLDPMPEKTPLEPVITGRLEAEDFIVEKLHFQPRPKLYVTANLYLPKNIQGRIPAVLYLCGHAKMKEGDVSLGNKTAYQHHGAWFARNGYACLVLDSLQLGEIEGLHHGTYDHNQWWWNSRGYSPAGVEAWNCIRALDYLETRPEINIKKIGATGRSGGGAYTWWIAALDERIAAAAPVAGITDLQNHVVDGCVEGHCDCMFFVNTYRWDYTLLPLLVMPRPLLIVNTDRDEIFPLDGVQRVHSAAAHAYKEWKVEDKLGLQISEGGHDDSQNLQVAVGHWFNRWLKGQDAPVNDVGKKFFEPRELRVFDALPTDSINDRIHETFVAREPRQEPPTARDAATMAAGHAREWLRSNAFRGFPREDAPFDLRIACGSNAGEGVQWSYYDFTPEENVRLPISVVRPIDTQVKAIEFRVFLNHEVEFADARTHQSPLCKRMEEECKEFEATFVILSPRGVGFTRFTEDERKSTQIRRRFMLLGQTLQGMQTYDILRGIQAARTIPEVKRLMEDSSPPLVVANQNESATASTMLAAFLDGGIDKVVLSGALTSREEQRENLDLLNISKRYDYDEIVGLLLPRSEVTLSTPAPDDWTFAKGVDRALGGGRLKLLPVTKEQ